MRKSYLEVESAFVFIVNKQKYLTGRDPALEKDQVQLPDGHMPFKPFTDQLPYTADSNAIPCFNHPYLTKILVRFGSCFHYHKH